MRTTLTGKTRVGLWGQAYKSGRYNPNSGRSRRCRLFLDHLVPCLSETVRRYRFFCFISPRDWIFLLDDALNVRRCRLLLVHRAPWVSETVRRCRLFLVNLASRLDFSSGWCPSLRRCRLFMIYHASCLSKNVQRCRFFCFI